MPDLEPITREEMLWSGEDIEPITREEMYIKHIFDKTQTIPSKPLTRKEMLLEKAGEGGGSDVTIKQLSVTANGTYSEEGTAYSPVIVNVPAPPIPDNAYLLNDLSGLPAEIASFSDGANLPMPKLEVAIEPIQEGSGDPSPTNIRPISGWTACNVVRTGENLFDKATITENKIIDSTTGEETAFYGRFSSDYIKVNPSTDYYASNVIRGAQWYCVFYYDKNKNYLSCGELPSTGDNASGVVTTPSGCNYVRLIGVSTYKDDVSFVVGNQAPSSYSAYNGHTYTIQLGDTYYGGKLDVVSGVLTVDRAYVDMGTLNWIYESDATRFRAPLTDVNTDSRKLISSIYHYSQNPIGAHNQDLCMCPYAYGGVPSIFCTNFSYTDSPTFKTAMNGVQLVYELATPLTIQLTPTQVNSLEGVNNIFADCGDIIDGQYFSKGGITI